MPECDLLKAVNCDCLAANYGLQPVDIDRLACLAHLADGRVHQCPIFYHSHTFIGGGLGGCVDWAAFKGEV